MVRREGRPRERLGGPVNVESTKMRAKLTQACDRDEPGLAGKAVAGQKKVSQHEADLATTKKGRRIAESR